MTPTELETEVMAHRYLYYVEATPVISDYEYDQLESKARMVCPRDSPINEPGSDLTSSYTEDQMRRALELIG